MGAVSKPELLTFDPKQAPALVTRRNTRRLSLRLDGSARVRVSAPHHVSQRQIAAFINSHQGWLTRARQRNEADYAVLASNSLGSNLPIVHTQGPLGAQIVGKQHLNLAHPLDFADWSALYSVARPTIKRWLNGLAKPILTSEVAEIAHTSKLRPVAVKVRWMRSRWGSCNQKGEITLNSQLLRLPAELRQYVICHELTHLKHKHHQANFWRALAGVLPSYQVSRRALRSFHLWY